jgi:hypothetical protein
MSKLRISRDHRSSYAKRSFRARRGEVSILTSYRGPSAGMLFPPGGRSLRVQAAHKAEQNGFCSVKRGFQGIAPRQ